MLAMKSLILVLILSLLRHTFCSLRYATWALAFQASIATLLGCSQEIWDPKFPNFLTVNYWVPVDVVHVPWWSLWVCEQFGFGKVEGEAVE